MNKPPDTNSDLPLTDEQIKEIGGIAKKHNPSIVGASRPDKDIDLSQHDVRIFPDVESMEKFKRECKWGGMIVLTEETYKVIQEDILKTIGKDTADNFKKTLIDGTPEVIGNFLDDYYLSVNKSSYEHELLILHVFDELIRG